MQSLLASDVQPVTLPHAGATAADGVHLPADQRADLSGAAVPAPRRPRTHANRSQEADDMSEPLPKTTHCTHCGGSGDDPRMSSSYTPNPCPVCCAPTEQKTTPDADAPLDRAVWLVASMLDRPSVFMGGPSQRNVRRAREIINALRAEGMMP